MCVNGKGWGGVGVWGRGRMLRYKAISACMQQTRSGMLAFCFESWVKIFRQDRVNFFPLTFHLNIVKNHK